MPAVIRYWSRILLWVINFSKKEGLGFVSGSTNQRFKTDLSDKLMEIPLANLSDSIISSFKNGEYKTFKTIKDVVLYRACGRRYEDDKGAAAIGAFATTEFAESRIDVKIRLALNPAWHNAKLVEEKIVVPIGIVLNIGQVAPVRLKTGTILEGGADQVLLPQNWSKEWIVGYREVTSKPLQEYPEYYLTEPKCYKKKKSTSNNL